MTSVMNSLSTMGSITIVPLQCIIIDYWRYDIHNNEGNGNGNGKGIGAAAAAAIACPAISPSGRWTIAVRHFPPRHYHDQHSINGTSNNDKKDIDIDGGITVLFQYS